MNGRKLTVLTALAGILALGEFGSAIQIGLGRDGPDRSGWPVAAAFGVFFLIAAWLLRRGRITAGAVFAGILCLFEILNLPQLAQAQRPGVDDRHGCRRGVTGRADRRHHRAGRTSPPPCRGLTRCVAPDQ